MLPEPIDAAMVRTTSLDGISLHEGVTVNILNLIRDGKLRWQLEVKVPGGDREVLLRPCLLGRSRTSQALRLPKLSTLDLMIQELNFWQHLWRPVSPRKAGAMERMVHWITSMPEERKGDPPSSVLKSAWSQYQQERRSTE